MSIEIILGIVIFLVGFFFLFLGNRKTNESNNLSRYVPADSISSIPFSVPVVANGTVTEDQPLISPVTQKPCVYFSYLLEKETETKDNNGNTSWKWEKVGQRELQTIPFYLEDKTGKILVKPDGCEVNGIYQTQQFLQPGTVQNISSKGLRILADAFQINTTTKGNRERVTEYAIFVGATLNVFGSAIMEGNQKFIQKTNEFPLVLSPLSKDQLVGSEKKNAYLLYGLGIILLIIGVLVLFQK
jgi:E3 ubiquitin ligase